MDSYKTVKERGEFSFEEKRSEFIGYAIPISTEDEAISFIAAVKKQYPDARHWVYAYSLRENHTMRYSDDGEPQGTAGIPILDIIRKKEITDICVVVVRYFGGILLGTGGLVHAYSRAAIEAINAAHVIEYSIFATLKLSVSYSDYQRVFTIMSNNDFSVTDTEYSDSVVIIGTVSEDKTEAFLKEISEATSGRCQCELIEKKFGFRE